VYTNTVKGLGQLAVRLKDAEVIVLIRERTHITRQLIEKLPKLRLVSQTGKVGSHIDVGACTERGIVLIFDEVFVGFRLAPGGAQEYFGVKADMVTYGKTLGGGLPVGVVCGKRELMKRFREDRPADICFARGTFNSHPYVMGAMQAFLDYLETSEAQLLY
ncbi:hypothetical protein KXX11_004288, partial [Aspergillus fumigatus]